MQYKDKLIYSDVIRSYEMPLSRANIIVGKKRFMSIIWAILMSAYTIFSRIYSNDSKGTRTFYILATLSIINIITVVILSILGKSIYSKNHFNILKVVTFINKLTKLLVFIMLFVSSLTPFIDFMDTDEGKALLIQSDEGMSSKDFYYAVFIENNLFQTIKVVFSIILIIPTAFYFLKVYRVCIPFVGIVVYLKWLFSNSRYFKEYRKKDDKKVYVLIRKVNTVGYAFVEFIKKCFLTVLIFAAIVAIVLLLEKINVSQYFKFLINN